MSLAKRILSIITIISVSVMLAGGALPARAEDTDDLAQQLTQLQQLLQQLCQSYYDATGEVLAGCEGYVSTTEQPSAPSGEWPAGIPEGFRFEKNLKYGMSDPDVKYLQILLNTDPDTKVAETGAGSPGNETQYFGPRTKAAVIKFQEKYADDVLAPWGLTHGTGFVGSTTRAKLNEILESLEQAPAPTPSCSDYTTQEECENAGCYWYDNACHEEQQPAPTPTALSVAVSDDTPAASVLVAGQGLADLVHYTFTNNGDSDVKVTQLKVKRGGVSDDTAITYLYLYKDNERLVDPVTLSSGYATFNDPTGLFTVPAGESVTVAVKADIASGISGQTVNISIESADDISSDADSVDGNFPLTGNTMSIATGTLASVDFNSTTYPNAAGSVDPGDTEYTVWKNTVSVSTRDVYLKYLRLKEIGSIESDDLQNFKLYVNGVEVAGPVQMSDDFYVTFDLTSNPVTLETGNRILEVRADVIDGSGKSFSFSLWYTADVILEDSQYGVNVIPTKGGSTFTPATTATISVNSGSLSVVRASDSPSGTVVINGSGVTLAKYTLTAYGEKIKVMTLKVCVDSSDNNVTKLRNGKLYANGVQVGSTADLYECDSATGYTTYNLGSSLIVEPGNPVTLEVKADIYDNDGTNDISASDTLQVKLLQGSNNGQRMTSMTLLNVPGSDQTGYTLTVASGNLTLVKNSSYGDQTTIAGVSEYKLGSYVLTSVSEDINITQFTVGVSVGGGGALTDLSNLYVKYGDNTTSPKTTVASSNTFTLAYTMAKGTQLVIEVYADISSSAANGATYTTTLTVNGTGVDSGTAVTSGSKTGQTITIGTASLTASLYSGTPDAGLVVAETEDVVVAKYKFVAQNADITLKDIYISLVGGQSVEDTIIGAQLDLNDDGTPDTPVVYIVDGTNLGFAGVRVFPFVDLNQVVEKGDSKVISVMLDLNDVTTNGDSGDNVAVELYAYTYNAGGADTIVQDGVGGYTKIAGNNEYVYDGYPVVEYQSLSDTTLTNGTKTLAKFTITAQGDEISWKKIVFSVTANDADGQGELTLANVKLYKGSTEVAGTYNNGTFEATSEQQIAAGESVTYYLKADISGVETGDSVLVKINSSGLGHAAPTTYANVAGTAATFVWSDMSATGHDETTSDWNNDYLIDYIPTDTWALNTSSS